MLLSKRCSVYFSFLREIIIVAPEINAVPNIIRSPTGLYRCPSSALSKSWLSITITYSEIDKLSSRIVIYKHSTVLTLNSSLQLLVLIITPLPLIQKHHLRQEEFHGQGQQIFRFPATKLLSRNYIFLYPKL